VSRILVTHAHIDHYGLGGRLLERTGAELCMHTMTDLDCEKYRHPDTARARRRDTYADHGVDVDERADLADHLTRWLPYLHSVVEASRRLRGGEELVIGGDRWEVVHTPGHSLGHVCLWSPARGVLLSGDHLLPAITPPVTFERGFDADPLRSYLDSLRRVANLRPRLVFPGHGRPYEWSQDRIWEEIQARVAGAGATIKTGNIFQKSILQFRSFVCEPMQYGRRSWPATPRTPCHPPGRRG
jgi:glyoxylase-like metal-dependent hydrolase (beta-lactamase superfamily II)